MKKIDENYFVNTRTETDGKSMEDFLDGEEQVLWRGKPKKSAYILGSVFNMLPFALVWLLFDGGFIATFVATKIYVDLPIGAIVGIAVFFLFHLTPVWIWLAKIITASREYKNVEYAFTNKRIVVRSGVIGIDFKNIYYSEIESVNLKVGLSDKILKVGDIYVKSKDSSQVLFDITDPYFITKRLQEIVVDIKTDIEFPNELRPGNNPGYGTVYKKEEN